MLAEKSTERAAKAAGMISLMFLLSRILGLVRESVAGRIFGSYNMDVFFSAFIIPDLMYNLLVGGALSAGLIPIFTEYLTKGEEEEGWKVASTFINITLLLLLCFTVLGVVFADWVAFLEAPDFPADKMASLVKLTRVMFPAVCFTALAGLTGGILNSYQHFFAPAFGSNFYNVAIILGAIILGPKLAIVGMGLGVVAGSFGNFLIQAGFLKSRGGKYYRPFYIDLKNPGFIRMIKLILPALVGLSAAQVNIWITNAMASSFESGSITALRYANRLIQMPIGIFAAGIAMAFFPLLSRLASDNKMDSFKDTLALALKYIFFIMIPSAIGLIILRYPIMKLIFEGQKLTPHDTILASNALLFYSIAIFAHAAILLLPRAFYALQDTKTPVLVSVSSITVSILLNWLFKNYTGMGIGGFALSFSIMGLINMIALLIILRRKIDGIRGRTIFNSFIKTSIAAAIMGVAILIIKWIIISFVPVSGHGEAALIVVFGMIFGIIVYFLAAWLLKINEMEMVINIIKNKLLRK
ncbi:MAG TPA: murein biosynthesis integral membrane protein MurJ [Bacillota bacterium]|nr:murein biosynthesis integral membrane protein MurJ [Bacillota bacterium]HOL08794.1 murein biosynthesis integral membrane protein MurJ [Bacillota bacterium]HPO96884.1 murein biosynthesis integral membrane protein MurJ [Bacillota bacterium]